MTENDLELKKDKLKSGEIKVNTLLSSADDDDELSKLLFEVANLYTSGELQEAEAYDFTEAFDITRDPILLDIISDKVDSILGKLNVIKSEIVSLKADYTLRLNAEKNGLGNQTEFLKFVCRYISLYNNTKSLTGMIEKLKGEFNVQELYNFTVRIMEALGAPSGSTFYFPDVGAIEIVKDNFVSVNGDLSHEGLVAVLNEVGVNDTDSLKLTINHRTLDSFAKKLNDSGVEVYHCSACGSYSRISVNDEAACPSCSSTSTYLENVFKFIPKCMLKYKKTKPRK